MVVGGNGAKQPTEKSSIKNDQMNCIRQQPFVNDFAYWPELFHVHDNFCL